MCTLASSSVRSLCVPVLQTVECYGQEGVGRLNQGKVFLTTLGFWELNKSSPSWISRVFHVSGWIGEIPGDHDYLDGDYSMGEAV